MKVGPVSRYFLLLVLAAIPYPPQAQDAEAEITRKDLTEKIAVGDSLTVTNEFGDVRARINADASELALHAVIQNLKKGTPAPEINIRRHEKNIVISVESRDDPKDRADLVLYIPQGVPIQVRTKAGLIELKGLRSDVSAETDSGAIDLKSVVGRVTTSNQRGETNIELPPDPALEPQDLKSQTGDISIFVWEGTDARVRLQTSGEISTDFSIHIDFDRAKEPDKVATTEMGNGKSTISAFSKRGRIRLLRLLKSLPQARDRG